MDKNNSIIDDLKELGEGFRDFNLAIALIVGCVILALIAFGSFSFGIITFFAMGNEDGLLALMIGIVCASCSACCYFGFKETDVNLMDRLKNREQDENKNKRDEINSLLEEIDRMEIELCNNRRIVEENKKAVFGEKAKLRRKAESRIDTLESEIKEKAKEAQRLKKTIRNIEK